MCKDINDEMSDVVDIYVHTWLADRVVHTAMYAVVIIAQTKPIMVFLWTTVPPNYTHMDRWRFIINSGDR